MIGRVGLAIAASNPRWALRQGQPPGGGGGVLHSFCAANGQLHVGEGGGGAEVGPAG